MKTEKYTAQVERLPKKGQQIIAAVEGENIIVYQAFNKQIADYAVAKQRFGGAAYSFNPMSWIKPGFLWMMYRAGWAQKENQQHILRITLPLQHFITILQEAAFTSYQQDVYGTAELWQQALENKSVRLQWDPDHDPAGVKQERKAIQLGIKGELLKTFCMDWIVKIEDITDFVKTQRLQWIATNDLDVPYEEVLIITDAILKKSIGIN